VRNLELQEKMIFNITEKFIPNFSKSQTLRIVELNEKTVRIEMVDAKSRGAFPIDHFKGLIKNGSLVLTTELELSHREEISLIESEIPAS
jgi:flagellar assembly factor FliW